MTTKMSLPFFFGDFHGGLVNRALHIVGYGVIVYGMWTNNWLLAVSSLSIAEVGHLYNHRTLLKDQTKLKLLDILKYQIVLSGVLLIVTYIAILAIKFLLK